MKYPGAKVRDTVVRLLLVLGAGCSGSIQVTHVRTGPVLAPKPAGYAMPVFFNQAPASPYREIGQIRVRSTLEEATLDNVVSAAIEDARALGADAVIIDARRGYHSVDVTVDCAGHPYAAPARRLNARVTAIVFTAPAEAQPERPPGGPSPRDGCPRR